MRDVEKHGLEGDRLFYITCRTKALKGLPDPIREEHPEKVTLVLQHDFHNLDVNAEDFSVELSFGGEYSTVLIPFDGLLSIGDPSVDFALFLPVKEGPSSPNVVRFDSLKKK